MLTCFFHRAVIRRIATAFSLGELASMWRVCSTMGTQSWKRAQHPHKAYKTKPLLCASLHFKYQVTVPYGCQGLAGS